METIRIDIPKGETANIAVGSASADHVIYIKCSAVDGAMQKSGDIEILNKGNLVLKAIWLGDNFTLTLDKNISGGNVILVVTANAGGSGVIFRYSTDSLKNI